MDIEEENGTNSVNLMLPFTFDHSTCVCVFVREKDREKERERHRNREREEREREREREREFLSFIIYYHCLDSKITDIFFGFTIVIRSPYT
jgi:hypothetical protein